jgi:predicted permease
MVSFLEALLPIFAVVVLGQLFYRYGFPGSSFWPLLDRLTYYVLLPALLSSKIATARLSGSAVLSMSATLVLATFLVAVLLVLIQWVTKSNPIRFTSVFQGSIRPNTYVALAAAGTLFPAQGLALTAIAIAGVVPLVNVLSVWAFTFYIPETDRNWKRLTKSFISNPLIVACLLGIVLNLTGFPVIGVEFLNIFSQAALPLGLLSVGAGLNFRAVRNSLHLVGMTAGLKLILLPALVALLFWFFRVDGISREIGLVYAAVPGAVSSYILSRQMGGDSQLMAGIITLETLFAIFTMPFILWLFST